MKSPHMSCCVAMAESEQVELVPLCTLIVERVNFVVTFSELIDTVSQLRASL